MMNKHGTGNIKPFEQSLRSRGGLTFVEMALVVALIGIVSLTAYRSLAHGLRIWDRSQRIAIEEDISIFFDKISGDIRNSFLLSGTGFEGKPAHLRFPTIVRAYPDQRSGFSADQMIEQIGMVEYAFDSAKDTLYQRQALYGQMVENEFGRRRRLARPVSNVTFRYYFQTADGYILKPETAGKVPLAVEVQVEFSDGSQRRTMSKFVNIPISG